MTSANRPLTVQLFTAYLLVFATRLALILNPPAGYFYNIDELEMTLSCLDRFLGIPSTSLQWPGSLLQLAMLPVWAVDLLRQQGMPTGMGSGLAKLASYLSHAYENPLASVTLLRSMVAAISSAAPILLFGLTLSVTGSKATAWMCAAALAFIPVFVRQSVMAMGEAAGLSFALAAFLLLVKFGSRYAVWAGIVFAAALACRITLASLLVLPLLLVAFDAREVRSQRLAGILKLAGGVIGGFLLWCPYIWTDPLRFAKALLGHLGHQPSLNPPSFAAVWFEAMGVSFTILAALSLAGAVYALSQRRSVPWLLPAFLATAIVSLPLLTAKVDLFPRYFLPLLCPGF